MNFDKFYKLAFVILLAAVIGFVARQAMPALATDPLPQTVSSSTNKTLYTVLSSTTRATSTGVLIDGYGVADCFSSADFVAVPAAGDSITTTLQSGFSLNGPYVTNVAMGGQLGTVGDSASFNQIPLYGHYLRAVAGISSSTSITVGVACVLKNNAGQ